MYPASLVVMMFDQTADGPANPKAEVALLGALLINPGLVQQLPPSFRVGHYSDPFHAEVHEVVADVGQEGIPAGLQVMQALGLGDVEKREYVASLIANAVTGANPRAIVPYAQLITDAWRRRGFLKVAAEIQREVSLGTKEAPTDAVVGKALSGLEAIHAGMEIESGSVSLADAMRSALNYAERAYRGERMMGFTTGFPSLDNAMGGLERSTLTYLGARPGAGKSALALQIAMACARDEKVGVLMCSLEMKAQQLGRRALALMLRTGIRELKKGDLQPRMWSDGVGYAASFDHLPLTIEDTAGLTLSAIKMKARSAKRRHGLGLLIIDHIHIMGIEAGDLKGGGATFAIGKISNGLKRLAKDLDVAVLCLAQLNRGVEQREDKRPSLADLRSSGDLEQDADNVLFVYRPEYYLGKGAPADPNPGESDDKFAARKAQWHEDKARLGGKAEIILEKLRDGEPDTVHLHFDGPTTSFSEQAA